MKRNLKKLLLLILLVALIIVLALLVRNRYTFGVWNPLSLPNRIECYDRRYYIAESSPKMLSNDKKPGYAISSADNLTGKDLYTLEPKGSLVPITIYLKTADGKYQQYVLSGGQ